jgi:hypothetical protein
MKFCLSLALIAFVSFILSCGRPTGMASDQNADAQKLPFDRAPRNAGISPTRSIVPSARQIPAGTAIVVSLERSLSSTTAHSDETFTALLDEPIVVEGQTVVAPGAPVTGRVLDARHASSSRDPGYLRISLSSLGINGKQFAIDTSSLFAKGGSREYRGSSDVASGMESGKSSSKEIVFAPGRRLGFRLTQSLDLQ